MNILFKQVEVKSNRYIWKMMICCGIGLLIYPMFNCNMTTRKASKDFAGNVYAPDKIPAGTGYKDQLQAIRIDEVRGDTILIKYKIDGEMFLDADLVWNPSAKNYKSLQALTYGDHAQFKSPASLYAEDDFLELQINKQKIHFRKLYNKAVDLKTHRDPYYAEEGFSLDP